MRGDGTKVRRSTDDEDDNIGRQEAVLLDSCLPTTKAAAGVRRMRPKRRRLATAGCKPMFVIDGRGRPRAAATGTWDYINEAMRAGGQTGFHQKQSSLAAHIQVASKALAPSYRSGPMLGATREGTGGTTTRQIYKPTQ